MAGVDIIWSNSHIVSLSVRSVSRCPIDTNNGELSYFIWMDLTSK